MRVLVFSAYFPPAFLGGGALKSVAAIVSQAPDAYDASVITADRDLGQREALDVVSNAPLRWGRATVYYASHHFHHRLRALKFARSIKPRIIYTNSFFDPAFSILPLVAWRLGLVRAPHFVIAPRGEFGPGALKIKHAKKSLFILIYRLFLNSRHITWHASSPSEAANIQTQVGMASRIIVREDNTALPSKAAPPTQPGENLRTVVIGRLVPVKGISELLHALAAVSIPLVLDIYGPEEDGIYAQRCHRLAAELPPHISVTFKGAIHSAEVTNTLRTYDLMLLPSRGENFSHVVAEALSVSLPVMCADVTPWSSYVAEGAGVLLADNAVPTWTKSVEEYARMSAAHKMSMRRTAAQQYKRWRESTDEPSHIFDLITANRLGT